MHDNFNSTKQVLLEGIKNISDIMKVHLDNVNDDTFHLDIKHQHGSFLELFNSMSLPIQNPICEAQGHAQISNDGSKELILPNFCEVNFQNKVLSQSVSKAYFISDLDLVV